MGAGKSRQTGTSGRAKVVIVGGGFGGLYAARGLADAPVDLVLIDRQNHHCFQPLLYQVATAALSPADVAWPIRGILSDQKNATVLLDTVTGIDTARRVVETAETSIPYDHLILATGSTHSYFGNDDWAEAAPGLKRIEDATEIRRRILLAFEKAELARDEERRRRLLTFVVVGGGPTGVEIAGAIRDMARHTLAADFRNIDAGAARVLIVEAGPRILPAFNDTLAGYAKKALERMGVEVLTETKVIGCDAGGVDTEGGRIEAGTIIWAAGVVASPAGVWLQAPMQKNGQVRVAEDLSVPGVPDVYAIGDTAFVLQQDEKPVPGIAPAAKQMGSYVAKLLSARVSGRPLPGPFVYRHRGDLATIGRKSAIVQLRRMRLTGVSAWLFWGAVHVFFLIGTRNRVAVAYKWMWDYLTLQRGARLITEPAQPRTRVEPAEEERREEEKATRLGTRSAD
ncbi:FAD-dependent pyridine nucleotide-disulphide oxidoreductase [Parvibaculum lavamentivorans DS-1]|uniref:NADH:ubiquinone reductase (non-electrogenic) n=1 Tax=Parvibaculum lavamentivorans (strain DS-1 / DSM 13023 / NCIMB 13966) TaxID=402881 RepID=A7HQ59_PARL1|nr:NAD(P)/FAD-dependent oxidoreductase [Parvibaculum lavamentivorans]ABS62042.1 FAD-dependent pyridine nucleotide-disulphide oxidoreductase [Parvibaculum lavamentivorans DS-1]